MTNTLFVNSESSLVSKVEALSHKIGLDIWSDELIYSSRNRKSPRLLEKIEDNRIIKDALDAYAKQLREVKI